MKESHSHRVSNRVTRRVTGGLPLNISKRYSILILFIAFVGITDCSSRPVQLPSPEERLEKARNDMEKRRYERANETLEELRPVTAGTRLGGEVQFLLAETRFRQGKFSEADLYYGTYLDLYPDGPFSEKALYMRALSKTRNIRKISIGLFTFGSYIPSDRDVSVLREARILFELYIEQYPSGQWADSSKNMARELLIKEGEHELSIASFYLKKDQYQAVIARAQRVLKGSYPDEIKTRARDLVRRAGGFPNTEVEGVSP